MTFVARVGARLDDLHTQLNSSAESTPLIIKNEASTTTKLGTLEGVFLPVVLSIWGIVVFLRIGFIVAHAGVLGATALWCIGYCICLLTTMSLSAIATNGKVRGGGPYYMISRSLGPEFGGSIGLCFYLSTVMNGVLNVLAFVEPLMTAWQQHAGDVIPQSEEYKFLVSTLVLLVCTLIPLLGTRAYARTESLLSAVLMAASISIFVSFVWKQPFVDTVNGVTYTGWNGGTLMDNLYAKFSTTDGTPDTPMESYRSIFGIIFSACNGILAGASMSGDLQYPSRSIPHGTIWGLLLTFVMHLAATVLIGASVERPGLYMDLSIMEHISIAPLLIAVGIYATAAFGAISSISSASRILQAIARDDLLPFLKPFAQGTASWDEPTAAVILTYIIMQLSLFTSDFNFIALLVAIFSLLTFGGLNLACLMLRVSSAPNFRPTFPYFNVWTALFGALISFASMFAVDAVYALASLVLLVSLTIMIHFLSAPKTWGDISQSLIYHQVRKFLLLLDVTKQHPKYWRPNILLIVNDPLMHFQLIHFCNSLKKGGLYIIGHVLKGTFDDRLLDYRQQKEAWATLIKDMNIKAFVHLTIAPHKLDGCRQLVTSSGLGGLVPNIVILPLLSLQPIARAAQFDERMHELHVHLGFHTLTSSVDTLDIPPEAPLTPTEFIQVIQDTLFFDKAIVVAHGFSNLHMFIPTGHQSHHHQSSEPKGFIDVWPLQLASDMEQADGAQFSSYTTVMQLGCILHTVKYWRHHYHLRIMCFVEFAHDMDEEHDRVKQLLEDLRIQAQVHVWSLEKAELPSYESARSLVQRNASTTVGPFALARSTSYDSHYDATTSSDPTSVYNRLSTSRQYEIINAMFRKYSSDATILLTTLAPPTQVTEGYCKEYIERLRKLTHGMPPMMMVHNKNMTVTAEL